MDVVVGFLIMDVGFCFDIGYCGGFYCFLMCISILWLFLGFSMVVKILLGGLGVVVVRYLRFFED